MVPLVPAGAVGAEISSNLARCRGFPEMLTTSCFPGSHLVPKPPKTAQKPPFLTRNGTKKQTGSPQRKPEAQGNTRKAVYTTTVLYTHILKIYLFH